MIRVLLGSDTVKAKARAMKLATGHELVRFGEGGEQFTAVFSYLGARGMFTSKVALFMDQPFADTATKEMLLENLDALASSDALVLIIEVSIDAATKRKLDKAGEIELFERPAVENIPPPSVFALTDAFASGKRKDAWILYRKLIEAGSVPEEIHGALSWQVRAMVLASKTRSAIEAGLKPFVFAKAKRASDRLPHGAIDAISRDLMHMVHESRMGKGDLGLLLEAYLLRK